MIAPQDIADYLNIKQTLSATDEAVLQQIINAVLMAFQISHDIPATPNSDIFLALTKECANRFNSRKAINGVIQDINNGTIIRVGKYDPEVDSLLGPYRKVDHYWGFA